LFPAWSVRQGKGVKRHYKMPGITTGYSDLAREIADEIEKGPGEEWFPLTTLQARKRKNKERTGGSVASFQG